MSEIFDVIIIGSGPSGALAASTLCEKGVSVVMIDGGEQRESKYDPFETEADFVARRKSDPNQVKYFLGTKTEDVLDQFSKNDLPLVGSVLTPPREYVFASGEKHLPTTCLQDDGYLKRSMALGGLGAAWAGACYTYSSSELIKMGLHPTDFPRLYNQVVKEIGVSSPISDDCCPLAFFGVETAQPPLSIDSNATNILEKYTRQRDKLNKKGFFLGRMSQAVLSREMGERKANPYYDMDFYFDYGKSIFRPRYIIDNLKKNSKFNYQGGRCAIKFVSREGQGVEVICRNLTTNQHESFFGKRLILCAGAPNSARIALKSLNLYGYKTPFLCGARTLVPTVNLSMLGQKVEEKRHSLEQLCGMFIPQDEPDDTVLVEFIHYSSLLLFKLLKEISLPPKMGLFAIRLLVNAFTEATIYHSDSPSKGNWIELNEGDEDSNHISVSFNPEADVIKVQKQREDKIIRILLGLGCLPLSKRVNSGYGESIHYAGTIPFMGTISDQKLGVDASYQIIGAPNVYAGDSSSWKYLPAKGLTLTIMANAKKVAEIVASSLGDQK